MTFKKIVKTIVIFCALSLIVFLISNSIFLSREEVALNRFREILFDSDIDKDLFEGPLLIEKNESHSVFHMISTVPKYGDAVIELTVPGKKSYTVKGKRKSLLCFLGTDEFPLNEAILTNLFGLPPTPKVKNDRTNRLRNVPLSLYQIECIADFLDIRRLLMEYYFAFNREYPEVLDGLSNFPNPGNFDLFNLGYLTTNDPFGREYFYKNLNYFVILGTPGENGEWDFDRSVLDSIYMDQEDHILLNGDDIFIKFRPVY